METTTLYVLALSGGKYYVGASREPEGRVLQHFAGQAAAWTQRYPPLRVLECRRGDVFDEDKLTKQYMQRYGIDAVRGGSYCALTLSERDRTALEKELATAQRQCFRCGSRQHFAVDCDTPRVAREKQQAKPAPLRRDDRLAQCGRCKRMGHGAPQCCEVTDRDGKPLEDDSWEPGSEESEDDTWSLESDESH